MAARRQKQPGRKRDKKAGEFVPPPEPRQPGAPASGPARVGEVKSAGSVAEAPARCGQGWRPALPALITTGVFFVVALFGICHHEMWRDEHQAWLVARDAHSLPQLFENMRYEGNPALWHLLLYMVTCFTSNPAGMQALHLLIACGFIFVFNRYAELDARLKVLFSFGYFTLYEYCVISRSYGLGVLLLFMVCALYRNRRSNSRNGSASDPNSANYFYQDNIANGMNSGYAVSQTISYSTSQNYLTDVGAFSTAVSPYGTFDQGGNVEEWTDGVIGGTSHVVRGGDWSDGVNSLASSGRAGSAPTTESALIGFRVDIVPEPSTIGCMAVGLAMLAWRRKRAV